MSDQSELQELALTNQYLANQRRLQVIEQERLIKMLERISSAARTYITMLEFKVKLLERKLEPRTREVFPDAQDFETEEAYLLALSDYEGFLGWVKSWIPDPEREIYEGSATAGDTSECSLCEGKG